MDEGFTCEVRIEDYPSACEGLDFYGEHEGKRYCVLHYPGEEKNKEDFLEVKKSKLAQKDYDFGVTVFPEGTSDFGAFDFDTDTKFTAATFIGTASFLGAQFSSEQTDFSGAHFSSEQTDFSDAQFRSAETVFQVATFVKEVTFTEATFSEKVAFWGSKANPVFGSGAWAWFNRCRIEKPEQFTFDTVLLHPCWFINTDVRKVDFTDVKWYGMPGGPEGTIDEEIEALRERAVEALQIVEAPHTLLSRACRRLSANAEENGEYPLANEFHYWSLDALRKESSHNRKERWHYRKETWDGLRWIRKNWRHVAQRCGLATTLRLVWDRVRSRHQSRPRSVGLIPTMYWALSGYGVRARRAAWILAAVWLIFAALYLLVPSPFSVFSAEDLSEAIRFVKKAAVYSLGAVARLNPEPRPRGPGLFQFLVIVEGLVGPLQIGLLFLAIRRQVMR